MVRVIYIKDLDLIYDKNYILDYELEKPVFGFSLSLSGKNFLGQVCKRHRLYRTLHKEAKKRRAKIYALNCNDDCIRLLIGNISHKDLAVLARCSLSNFSHFIKSLGGEKEEYIAQIVLIASAMDFKHKLYHIASMNGVDLATDIQEGWNGLSCLLIKNWEYEEMIDTSFLSSIYKSNKDKLASTIFKIENIKDEKPSTKDSLSLSLANYYGLPASLFILFPKCKDRAIKRSLKNKDLFNLLVYNLRAEGLSYREIANKLSCSHTKIYNTYTRSKQ